MGLENRLISIIIVNWNGLRWLKKCLDSLYAQTYKNFEIVFVDNGSQDDSIVFVEKNYPKARIFASKENLGFAGGNNLGIKNSSGSLILLLNNDTWVENDFLEKIISFYNSHNYDIIAPTEARYSGEKHDPFSISIDLLGHPIYFFGKTKEFFCLSGVCLFFNKNIYTETGGLDDDFFMYFEDSDWFWRLNLFEKKFYQNNDFFVYHGKGGSTGGGIKYKNFLWRNQNTLQMLLKNYKWFNLLWILPIYFIQNVFEIIFFLFILQPRISLSYIQGWWFNVVNLGKIMQKRKWVQKNRKTGDLKIMKKMYKGFGKLIHLNKYFLK